MLNGLRCSLVVVLGAALSCAIATGQGTDSAKTTSSNLKAQMRMPWTRSNPRFIRHWLVLTDLPLTGSADGMEKDWLTEHGGEAAILPTESMVHHLTDGSTVSWRSTQAYGDVIDLSDGRGIKHDLVGYAFATVSRKESGKALLSLGSDESIRVWVNGNLVLDKRTTRQLTFDEDRIAVDLKAGDNSLLIKLEQKVRAWTFAARVLERGAILSKLQEIGPSLTGYTQGTLSLITDINGEDADRDKVTLLAVGAGGKVLAKKIAARGEVVHFDASQWPDGAYELRCTTHNANGLLYATHIPWYKGDAIRAAQDLIAAAAKSNQQTPEGMTIAMLADLVRDRLGNNIAQITGNPWWVIHSTLMEYEELKLETQGQRAQDRPYGFVRLAYRDDIDNSPQFCRAYLPGKYDRSKKWPLIISLHGFLWDPSNYTHSYNVDSRHEDVATSEYAGGQGVIYIEPHGRANSNFVGIGDTDVMRAIQLAKERFNIDEDRIYLTGESMGAWGTWSFASRHPDLFAAIAPLFGGSDYHSELSEEQLAKLAPLDRYILERRSSWSMADSLMDTAIFVHQGDADKLVNPEYSRYGVRLLERWGFDVRYHEVPDYGHEDQEMTPMIVEWFLGHRRVRTPSHVRIRSTELRNASNRWVSVDQEATPNEFMVVDAAVVGTNTIRIDSENVLALTLLSEPDLVDPTRDVTVVWNGDPRTTRFQDGQIKIRATGYEKGSVEKNSPISGPISDIFNYPFAIVVGTSSTDSAMKDTCRRKAEALANFWKSSQGHSTRVFLDSELSDEDAARYSLILIGDRNSNLITGKLGSKLPLVVTRDEVKIGDRSFAVSDARVQAIFPNPLNPQRYVLVVAATSPAGLSLWVPDELRVEGGGGPSFSMSNFDFAIEDGHLAEGQNAVSASDLRVAAGWFDRRWQIQDSLIFPGDADLRSKSAVLKVDRRLEPQALEPYIGKYFLRPGLAFEVSRDGNRLLGRFVGDASWLDMIPVREDEFFILEGSMEFVFEKDRTGKFVAFKEYRGGGEYIGKKME